MSFQIVLLLNLASTLFMTGVIWFVQVVHYPLFGRVGQTGYSAYAAAHSHLTTFVVAAPMLLELITAVGLAAQPSPHLPLWPAWLGLALVGVLWLSTLLLQIPRHEVLGAGYDPAAHRFLVASNWIRTIAWSLRAVLALWMTAALMGGVGR